MAAKIEAIKEYDSVPGFVDQAIMEKQAKLCLVIEKTVEAMECDASTMQCWNSVENNYA